MKYINNSFVNCQRQLNDYHAVTVTSKHMKTAAMRRISQHNKPEIWNRMKKHTKEDIE